MAVAHADPALAVAAQGLRHYPSDLTNPHSVVARVLRTGQAAQVTQAPEVWVERIAQDAEHWRILRALQPSSCLAVPLLARGQTLGALVVYRAVPEPPFAPEEVALAEELARRAALAIDNARLYAAEQAARRGGGAGTVGGEEQGTTLSVWLPGDASDAEAGAPHHPEPVAR